MQGGISVPAPNVAKLATVTGGTAGTNAARRVIVETARCNDCHKALGVFTSAVFHAGQRNDAPTCTFCHNPNLVNSGWSVNIKEAVHAIHAADKRANKFSWEAAAGDKYWEVTYPGVLNNCEQCHVPGSYDFSNAANAAAVPNLLWTTVATGTVPNPVSVIVTGNETIPGNYYSPFVTAGANYGSGFAITAAGVTTQPALTTLVSSPITSACFACHDTLAAKNHMQSNGGAIYQPRSSVGGATLFNLEACLVCHGSGKVADIKAVHMQ
jgi:OmcA/MtrC family decaheme c-type cytochrome